MRYRSRLIATASVLLLGLLAACGPSAADPAPLPVGAEVELTGSVEETIDDCAFDGICAYVVATDRGRVIAVWAEGMLRCAGSLEPGIAVGDRVAIRAAVTAPDRVSICGAPDYFIRTP